MIFSVEKHEPSGIALKSESGESVTYGELCASARTVGESVSGRCLVFCLCRNVPASVIGYVGFLSCGKVPLLLGADIGLRSLENIIKIYEPSYFWAPEDMAGDIGGERVLSLSDYVLLKVSDAHYDMNDSLALLLATSGSTGSPKLVRLSRRNIEANTESIAEYLAISEKDRPITTLPMNYTYGLSVINSHLLRGATVLMTERSVVELPFWKFFMSEGATTFGGVPYTYEILKKLRFTTMKLPSLRYLTQAGGKLPKPLQEEMGRWAKEKGVGFVVMYGQTEATARMAYLPADKCLEKPGSMGVAIPGGRLYLADTDGKKITSPYTAGELVYEGENVSLGYAECLEDLKKGDERKGVLFTGDIAFFDADGFFYIVGRKKRFIKIFGVRVSLDESEQLLKNEFPGTDFACVGRDDLMTVYVTDEPVSEKVPDFLAEALKINVIAFKTKFIPALPKSDSGKTVYKELEAE